MRLRVESPQLALGAPRQTQPPLPAVETQRLRAHQFGKRALRCPTLQLQLKETVAGHNEPQRPNGIVGRRRPDVGHPPAVVHDLHLAGHPGDRSRELGGKRCGPGNGPHAHHWVQERPQGRERPNTNTAHIECAGQGDRSGGDADGADR